jgi:hypothetical protein
MAVRIFKILSGELIIGHFNGKDTGLLQTRPNFQIINPFILHHTPQGVGLVPMMPWNKPSEDMVMTFAGHSVMSEALDVEAINSPHQAFVDDYKRATSTIQVPPPSPIQLVR